MIKGLLILLLLISTALPACGGVTNTSGPWGIDVSSYAGFRNLSSAAHSTVTANRHMVITDAVSCNDLTISADRVVDVKKGGKIRYAGHLHIAGPVNAGIYQILEKVGSGWVTFGNFVKEIPPEWLGTITGIDDSLVMQQVFDTGKAVVLQDNTIYVVANNEIKGNPEIYGKGWNSVLKQKANTMYGLTVNAGTQGTSDPIQNMRNIHIHDLQMLGTVATEGFAEFVWSLVLNAVSDVTVERVKFVGWRGDAINLGATIDAIERHNERIVIRDCYFDGVNNQNRNGITIADATNLVIDHNYFARISHGIEPGAIDLEPNPHGFERTSDITIINNEFVDIGDGPLGGVGVALQFTTAQGALTTKAQKFLVANNKFRNVLQGVSVSQPTAPSDTSISNDVLIINNDIESRMQPIVLMGVKGLLVADNKLSGSGVNVLSGDAASSHNCVDVKFLKNRLYNVDLSIQDISGLEIGGNRFNAGNYAPFRFGPGTSAYVNIHDNTILDPGSSLTELVYKNAAHNYTWGTNTWLRNIAPTGLPFNFKASVADRVNTVDPLLAMYIYNTSPDSMPFGRTVSYTYLPDAGLPDGISGGMYIVEKYSTKRETIIEWLYPENGSDPQLKMIYYRKGLAGSDAWSGWQPVISASPVQIQVSNNVSQSSPYTVPATVMGGKSDVVLVMTTALAGAGTLVTDTAANIIAAMPLQYVNFNYKLRIINKSSGAYVWTLTAGAGVTLNGNMSITQNGWRDFVIYMTSANTVYIQSVGAGTD